ncbi:MAG: hypothetical protein AMXMBFR56_47970 [Polyangiaceae bacterium]
MRFSFGATLALLLSACAGGGGSGGGDGTRTGFAGLWQYQVGSFSFVNCYTTSTTVPLAKNGFQIVEEAGKLVRVNPDGCRFSVVQTTALHASGVAGEQCTVNGTDPYGDPLVTRYQLGSLLMELRPDDQSEMIEVFQLGSVQTSSLGTFNCEISGNNSLDRGP